MNSELIHNAPADNSISNGGSQLQSTELPEDYFDLTIEAGRAEKNYWVDLWRYRELFYILAWRDISIRYKQTCIGVAWALLQPLLTMLVMTIVFSRMAQLPSEGSAPYAIMVFAAMLPWMFFSSALTSASQSLVGNANLISKVYFPRLIIPAAAVVTAFADFLISFTILGAMMLWYGFGASWRILTLPLFVGMGFLASLGPGLFITALNVKFRDFRYVIPFIVQFGLYVSPVGFSSGLVREKFGGTLFSIYSLNPMVGVIDGFRWAVLGGHSPLNLLSIVTSFFVTVFFLILGVVYFRKTERSFADII